MRFNVALEQVVDSFRAKRAHNFWRGTIPLSFAGKIVEKWIRRIVE
jgi:hypothetical protein